MYPICSYECGPCVRVVSVQSRVGPGGGSLGQTERVGRDVTGRNRSSRTGLWDRGEGLTPRGTHCSLNVGGGAGGSHRSRLRPTHPPLTLPSRVRPLAPWYTQAPSGPGPTVDYGRDEHRAWGPRVPTNSYLRMSTEVQPPDVGPAGPFGKPRVSIRPLVQLSPS